MANFEFATTGPRRTPNVDEKANGFDCGPADQPLFNGLFHRIEAELGHLITYAGLSPTDADYTQVRKAIVGLIDAATGGGETENYVLNSQLASRMPIFPEIQTADGRLIVFSPGAGTVRAPGGVNFLHRGFGLSTPVLTDFATVAGRTYHLRWSPTGGLALKWLGDAAYNPGGLVETDVSFDSTYDDMLISRVITNGANVATIINLANKNRLGQTFETYVTDNITWSGAPGFQAERAMSFTYGWGRKPDFSSLISTLGANTTGNGGLQGVANIVRNIEMTRYGVTYMVASDFDDTVSGLYVNSRVSIAA